MSMAELFGYQGLTKAYGALQIANNDGTPAINVYTSGSVLSASVSQGQGQAAIFSPTVAWVNSALGIFSLSMPGSGLALLDPAGEYYVLVTETTAGIPVGVWEGRLKVFSTPGSTVLLPPDLITYDYAMAAMSELSLSDTQRDFVPFVVSAASQAIRRHCRRNFDLRTNIVDWLDIALDGTVRLYQVPVQIVTRCQAPPSQALQVYNNSNSVQTAQCYFTYTGMYGSYSNPRTPTGLTLNWTSNGALSTTTINFVANQTIDQLSALINAVGSGWTAQSTQPYGPWAVTELDGGFTAQGASLNAVPGTGAIFNVLLDLGTPELDDYERGFLQVGRLMQSSLAQTWGPGGDQLFSNNRQRRLGRAKVTYTAGFSPIPPEIQYQCAQLVKWKTELGIQELLLKSETAADYAYTLQDQMIADMPYTVRTGLSQWVLHYA
jgi:hypothetical protein